MPVTQADIFGINIAAKLYARAIFFYVEFIYGSLYFVSRSDLFY